MLSIIIPTLNEEKYLSKLLRDLKNQTFNDYEIIVADADSNDKTVEIAKYFGVKIVNGGLPAVGRNKGAAVAKGEFFYFLDADVRLPKYFLEKTSNEMQSRNLELASCKFEPLSNLLIDKIMHQFANLAIKLSQFSSKPLGSGCCILVSAELFKQINGFNESLKILEDHDFISRGSKIKPFRILGSSSVKLSIRRLEKENRFVLGGKYFLTTWHWLFKEKIKDDIIDYKFGDFTEKNNKSHHKNLKAIERQLIHLDRELNRFSKKYFNVKNLTKNYKNKLNEIKKNLLH